MDVEAATENASLSPTDVQGRGLEGDLDEGVWGVCDLEEAEPPRPPPARLGAIDRASLISLVNVKS